MFVLIFGAIILLLLYFLLRDYKEVYKPVTFAITICFSFLAMYVPSKYSGFLYKDGDKVIPYENNHENFIKLDEDEKGFTYTYEAIDDEEEKYVIKEKYIKLKKNDTLEVIQGDVPDCRLTVFENEPLPSLWTFGISRPQYRYVFTLPLDEKLIELETCKDYYKIPDKENIEF